MLLGTFLVKTSKTWALIPSLSYVVSVSYKHVPCCIKVCKTSRLSRILIMCNKQLGLETNCVIRHLLFWPSLAILKLYVLEN